MIGVAISTHNRRQVFLNTLTHWRKHLPGGAVLVVVDDGSTTPVPDIGVPVVRHEQPKGVAAAKNVGITALMDAGCTDLFLSDDDAHPVTDNWWQPYVTDPEPHLMHSWGTKRLIKDDGHYTHWRTPCGVMLYTHRTVIERVGGLRTEYGRWGGEHAEWSRRIHRAGLTTYRYADLTAARKGIWHCEDYKRSVPSSVPPEVRAEYFQTRYHTLRKKFAGTSGYVEYRT